MTAEGPKGLRIDKLARDLKATKGSFYWHFDNLSALKIAILESWEQLATHQITKAVQSADLDPLARLRMLFDMVSIVPGDDVGGLAVEPAIRDWGRSDPDAKAVVARVDAQRLRDLQGFLSDLDDPPSDPSATADLLYASVIGLEHLRLTSGTDMRKRLHELGDALLPKN